MKNKLKLSTMEIWIFWVMIKDFSIVHNYISIIELKKEQNNFYMPCIAKIVSTTKKIIVKGLEMGECIHGYTNYLEENSGLNCCEFWTKSIARLN